MKTSTKSAINLEKYLSKTNNKSRIGKIFSLDKMVNQVSMQQINPPTPININNSELMTSKACR